MGKIKTLEELREAIRDLEHQNYVNEQHMRRKVAGLAERLKPANLLKSLFGQLLGGKDIRSNLLRMAGGLITSFVVKKFFRNRVAR
jgi:hypothetical protein